MTVPAGDDAVVVQVATSKGFWLTIRPLDNGRRAWTWIVPHDNSPKPFFRTRRQAIEYMREHLGMTHLLEHADAP